MEIPENHERLMELVGLVRDGRLDDSYTTELETILRNDPQALAYYVESIDLTAMLYRQQGVTGDDQAPNETHAITPMPTVRKKHRWWLVASGSVTICASLLAGVLGGRLLLPVDDLSTRNAGGLPQTASGDSEIATLSFSTGCHWDLTDQSRYEGQRLTPETLRLVEGVAVVHFDCDVQLTLEGPAHLDLASVDRAMLRYGKVVFSGDGDLEQFTLETPFSKIQDEGTEYAVSVDRAGNVGEVHVFDGRVNCEPSEQGSQPSRSVSKTIQIDAGDARQFVGPNSVKPIKLAASRFVREPAKQTKRLNAQVAVENFVYPTGSVVGRSGGSGWKHGWTIASEKTQGAVVRSGDSLRWPGQSDSESDGSLIIQGHSGLQRRLQDPICMDQDGVYYLSFLVRNQTAPVGTELNGWVYLTLRNSQEKTGHISIGPKTQRGVPRVAHDGRVANATSPLQDNVVYLFVCKILARAEKKDQVQVRIYNDAETIDSVEPSAWNITTRSVHTDGILNELRLSAKNSRPLQLDEVRIGKTWSSVTSQVAN
ncbi:hypothetical protein [Planctomycetes bacterium K23_9]|uniref:FecR protein n=1 Tax=Stieleria marina TaxID=1930275 RepID=A0A517NM48_9BACT|nr:FecR protein [Planctomycetes bacterium K23_9]